MRRTLVRLAGLSAVAAALASGVGARGQTGLGLTPQAPAGQPGQSPYAVTPQAGPWWHQAVPGLQVTHAVPDGWTDGWSFTMPVVDMPVHLDWLVARIVERGGTITRLNLSALPEGRVVNCSGLGARLLGADRTVVPVRGQVAYVEQVGLDRWWLDNTVNAAPTFVVPRQHDIVVGGAEVEGEWSRTPSRETADDILARASRLVPELRGARVLRHKVGLHPVRPAVRLEQVGDVVHCYGHGGAGVTLSWGVADEVVTLLDR